MRCFIAIDLSEEIRSAISGIIKPIRNISSGIRWVDGKNIHLTLKFLGETDDKLIPEISERLSAIGMRHRAFTLDIRGVGAFPNYRRPNVLWIGIDKSDELERLYLDIEESMSRSGFKKEERGFSPHLTIARVKDRRGLDEITKELYEVKDTYLGTMEAREVKLMSSVLKQAGAEYSLVKGFQLSE